jgi:hypothetical protein
MGVKENTSPTMRMKPNRLMGISSLLILAGFYVWSRVQGDVQRTYEEEIRRTTPYNQKELPSPNPGGTSRQEFLLALKRYGELHNDMLDGKRPGKYLTFCSAPSGWSDRVRGFISVATVAFMTDRAFLFKEMPDINMTAVYAQDNIRWFAEPDVPVVHSFGVGYMRLEEELLREDTIERMREQLGNIQLTMSDWAWEDIARHPLLATDRARLRLDDVPEWASLLFDFIFPPSPIVKDALRDYVDLVPSPRMAIHIRTGAAEGSNQFFSGSLETYVEREINCFKSVVKSEGFTKVTVFLATDIQPAFDIAKALIEAMQGENLSVRVMDGSAMGSVGHLFLEQHHTLSTQLRANTEWEILRRSEWVFPSRSGFSLLPFGLRHSPSTRAFTTNLNPAGACEEIQPLGLGWFFMIENLGRFP